MQAERAAINLSPRDDLYRYHLAQIYVASKQWDAAQALLDRLKASSDPQIAALARELIERAATERKYGIPLGAGGEPQPKLAPQKSPFDVLDEDAARARRSREYGRKPPRARRQASHEIRQRPSGRVDCTHAPAAILTVTAGGYDAEAARRRLQIAGPDRRRRFFLRLARPPGHGELQARRLDERRCGLAGSAVNVFTGEPSIRGGETSSLSRRFQKMNFFRTEASVVPEGNLIPDLYICRLNP